MRSKRPQISVDMSLVSPGAGRGSGAGRGGEEYETQAPKIKHISLTLMHRDVCLSSVLYCASLQGQVPVVGFTVQA